MNEQEVAKLAIAAFEKIKYSRQNITAGSPLSDLDLDSLDTLEWFMEIEQRLGIELDLPELADCRTVGEVAKWIVEHKQPNSPGSGVL